MPQWKGLAITWLGHAAVHITTPAGTEILIDPFLEHNPKYPKGYKLPEKLDLMLLTHGHSDHIADAVSVAKKHRPEVVAIFELATWIGSKGVEDTVGMNLEGSYKHKDVTVSMVEAHHSSSIQDGNANSYGEMPRALSWRRKMLRCYITPEILRSSQTCDLSRNYMRLKLV